VIKNIKWLEVLHHLEKSNGCICHNDVNDSGKNIIHRIEEFEKNIVGPVMEKEKMMGNDIEEVENPVVKKNQIVRLLIH
jgi:hypothetical protein